MATRKEAATRTAKRPPSVSPAGKKIGRPCKLSPDATTLKTVAGLGKIGATTLECAAVLGVDEKTWIKFRDENPEVRSAYDNERGKLRTSLRRKQVQLALEGNVTMLIWLGKNELAQSDKVQTENTHSGPEGEALSTVIVIPDNGRPRVAADS
jgi:hypothetical protein